MLPMLEQMLDSKYLKQHDVTPPKLVTLKNISKEKIGENVKWIIYFYELEKPLASGISTNLKTMARIFGSKNANDWINKKLVIYWNPDVEFGGDMVGGIRLRAIKASYQAPQNPQPIIQSQQPGIAQLSNPMQEISEMEDDIPF